MHTAAHRIGTVFAVHVHVVDKHCSNADRTRYACEHWDPVTIKLHVRRRNLGRIHKIHSSDDQGDAFVERDIKYAAANHVHGQSAQRQERDAIQIWEHTFFSFTIRLYLFQYLKK